MRLQAYIYGMDNFDPAFLVDVSSGLSAAALVRKKIQAWITSAWLVDLVRMFGSSVNSGQKLNDILNDLEAFSDRWDFRRMARERGVPADDALRQGVGAARWLTTPTELTEGAEARILDAAGHLGLVHATEPNRSSYDSIVVLGGARLSCKLRPLRAAEVIASGVTTNLVALLAAPRPIPSTERDATDTYAPGAKDEFELIVAGGAQTLGFDPNLFQEDRYDHPSNNNLSWIVRSFRISPAGKTLRVIAISAPSSDPDRRRANSADTLAFLLDKAAIPIDGRLLLITSQIYVPYVQLEALRTIGLPRRLLIETIGFPGDRMPELQGLTNANHYLQEIRSAIQAAQRFCQAYPE